jgi:hypothetical protein
MKKSEFEFKSTLSNTIKNLKGFHLKRIYFKKASMAILENLIISGIGDFYISGFNPKKVGKERHLSLKVNALREETEFGEFSGLNFQAKSENKSFEALGFDFYLLLDWEKSKIEKILHFGQVKSDLGKIDVVSMEFLAILLSSNKWIYICSLGNSQYDIYIDTVWSLDEFINLYTEGGLELQLIEEI